MRRRSPSLIAALVLAATFGGEAGTATSKPVDLKLDVTGSPAGAVVAGEIVTARASILKLTRSGGAATSFRFLYNLSRGLELVEIRPSSGRFDRESGSLTLMQLTPGKRIAFTIRARVLPGASRSVSLSATVSPGVGWRETRLADNTGVRRWTIAPPPQNLGATRPTTIEP